MSTARWMLPRGASVVCTTTTRVGPRGAETRKRVGCGAGDEMAARVRADYFENATLHSPLHVSLAKRGNVSKGGTTNMRSLCGLCHWPRANQRTTIHTARCGTAHGARTRQTLHSPPRVTCQTRPSSSLFSLSDDLGHGQAHLRFRDPPSVAYLRLAD